MAEKSGGKTPKKKKPAGAKKPPASAAHPEPKSPASPGEDDLYAELQKAYEEAETGIDEKAEEKIPAEPAEEKAVPSTPPSDETPSEPEEEAISFQIEDEEAKVPQPPKEPKAKPDEVPAKPKAKPEPEPKPEAEPETVSAKPDEEPIILDIGEEPALEVPAELKAETDEAQPEPVEPVVEPEVKPEAEPEPVLTVEPVAAAPEEPVSPAVEEETIAHEQEIVLDAVEEPAAPKEAPAEEILSPEPEPEQDIVMSQPEPEPEPELEVTLDAGPAEPDEAAAGPEPLIQLQEQAQPAKAPASAKPGKGKAGRFQRIITGIEFGTCTVKVVHISREKTGPVLQGYGVAEIEPHETLKEQEAAALEALKKALSEAGPGAKEVTVAVSGSDLNVSSLPMQNMDRKNLAGALLLEVFSKFNFPTDNTYCGYEVIELPHLQKENKIQVISVVARKSLVNRVGMLCRKAKLLPVLVSAAPFALENIVRSVAEPDEKEFAVIDVGSESTTICFISDDRLMYSRDINIASNDIDEAITGTYDTADGKVEVFPADAGYLKKTYGIPLSGKVLETADGRQIPVDKLSNRMLPVLERLLTEIQRTLSYYKSNYKVSQLDRVFLTGGGGKMANLDALVSRGMGAPATVLDPLEKCAVDYARFDREKIRSDSPLLAVAMGLALDQKKKVDLTTADMKMEKQMGPVQRIIIMMSVICLAALAALYGYQKMYEAGRRKDLATFRKSSETLAPSVEKIERLATLKKGVRNYQGLYKGLAGVQPRWEGLLKELSAIAPENLYLEQLEIRSLSDKKLINLRGVIFGGQTPVDSALSNFLVKLEASPFFRNINLISSEKGRIYDYKAVNFYITCEVIYLAPSIGKKKLQQQGAPAP